MTWLPTASAPECGVCGAPLLQHRQGRPAEYCSHACRQAAYRRRRAQARSALEDYPSSPRTSTAPAPSPEDELLLTLAKTARAELTRLISQLTPQSHTHTHGNAIRSPLTSAAEARRRLDVLLAGLVLRARHHDIPWEDIGNLLGTSPDAARRAYREHAVRQKFDELDLDIGNRYISTKPQCQEEDAACGDEAPAHPQPARSQLAPILSRLQRQAGIPVRQLGERVSVSPSYLSRLLSGERFPSWRLTELLGRALGADLCILRHIWEDEHRRLTADRLRTAASTSPSSGRPRPHTDLASALRALVRRCGSPSPQSISIVIDHALSQSQLDAALAGTFVPDWPRTERLVRALRGDPQYFEPLWQRATRKAGSLETTPAPPPPASPDANTPHSRVESLLEAFGPTLATPPPAYSHR
ncbi:helix-turn-helix domain-containing protein [Streptomyces albus]|uniref:XRE family transcriptional regulator n=1 Tax=Streptomyces albus TaxID=1888 RepID=A0A8H1L598_9ACTN|nr:helix-turn-helix transcriptional regulator [Streptomyces albus]TGG78479.1 XRE family transcriptional regulator [Streptomyces albus]